MNKTRGVLTNWIEDKGFGFIRPDSGGKDVFVHIRDFGTLSRQPKVGDVIWFQATQDGKGKFRAADVAVEGLPRLTTDIPVRKIRKSPESKPATGHFGLFLIVLFGCVIGVLTVLGKLDVFISFMYIIMSFCTIMLYAFDKSAAMNNRWRTPENTLHLFSLLGGWPGALVAQRLFRHKSRKTEFLASFWITVIINIGLVIGSTTAQGQSVISMLLGRFTL